MWLDVLKNESSFFHFHIEMTSKCNAACPYCPRYKLGEPSRNASLNLNELNISQVKKLIPVEVIQKVGTINFCGNFGDPLVCKDAYEIVEYFHTSNKKTQIEVRTNGGARSKEIWTKFGELSAASEGKLEVVFSIDGLEDTNDLYRRNVKWDKLMENVTAFTDSGGIAKWEFLVFRHNEHQMEDARTLSQELNFKQILFKRPYGFEDYFNKKTKPIPVYTKEGDLDYILEPAKQFSNSNLPYDGEIDGVPLKINTSNNSCNLIPQPINYEKYKEEENYDIKCQAIHDTGNIEVYINANADVRPCCHLGVELDRNQQGSIGKQLKHLFSPPTKFNLGVNSLESILGFFDEIIENNWDKTHEEGRCMKCSMNCGSPTQTNTNRLYVKEFYEEPAEEDVVDGEIVKTTQEIEEVNESVEEPPQKEEISII